MSTLKTSISILALVAGLSIGLASQPCFAQSAEGSEVGAPAGAGIGAQQIADAVKKRDEQLAKLDEEERKRQANLAKQNTSQPTTSTTGTGTTSTGTGTGTTDAGGHTGFVNPPAAEKPEEPGIVSKCWNGICHFFNTLLGDADSEAEEKQQHLDELHKFEEQRKAESNKTTESSKTTQAPTSTDQPKTVQQTKVTATNSTELKIVTPKADAPKTVQTNSQTSVHYQAPTINTHTPEVSRPTVSVPHPTINISTTVRTPTIQIPTVVVHR